MACDSITDYVTRESGRILTDVLARRAFARSPWLRLMPRGTWPKGLGETISVLAYERNAPAVATPTWTQVAVVDGAEGGACLPAAEKVSVGSTKRDFTLYRRVLEGPDFCAVELHSAFELEQQLNAIANILTNRVIIEWEDHDRFEYYKACKYKVLINACPATEDATTSSSDWMDLFTDADACTGDDADATMSILTQGILDYYRALLIRDGAAETALGTRDGSPVLTLITSMEASDLIIKSNSDNRNDLRYGAPNKLLAPLGVVGDYRGFYHVHDPFNRRFYCSGGTLTAAPQFTLSAATKGIKAEINSTWRTADLEESFIFDQGVMTQLVPSPIVAPHPKFVFDPVNYVGDIKAMNIPDRVCNPDGTIIYHRAIMAASSQPMYPERGVAFLHRRCDPACNLVLACTT